MVVIPCLEITAYKFDITSWFLTICVSDLSLVHNVIDKTIPMQGAVVFFVYSCKIFHWYNSHDINLSIGRLLWNTPVSSNLKSVLGFDDQKLVAPPKG